MLAQQSLYVKDPATGTSTWMSMDDINAIVDEARANGQLHDSNGKLRPDTLYYQLYTAIGNSNDAWSDLDESYGNKGHYERKPTPTPVLTPPPPPDIVTPTPNIVTPTPNIVTPTPSIVTPTPSIVTPTPSIVTPTPSIVTPTPTPTPTPSIVTPTPTATPTKAPTPTPPPDATWYVIPGDAGDNGKSPTAQVKIDNTKFGVFQNFGGSGKPIPTSENLEVEAISNLCGAVRNMGAYRIHFNPAVYNVYASYSVYSVGTDTDYKYDTEWETYEVEVEYEKEDGTKGKRMEERERIVDCDPYWSEYSIWGLSSIDVDYEAWLNSSTSEIARQTQTIEGEIPYVRIYNAAGEKVEVGFLNGIRVENSTLGADGQTILNANQSFSAVFTDNETGRVSKKKCSVGTFSADTSAISAEISHYKSYGYFNDLDSALSTANTTAYEKAEKAAENKAKSATVYDFWNVANDVAIVKGESITQNGAVLGCATNETASETIPNLRNRSVSSAYMTNATHIIKWQRTGQVEDKYDILKKNHVRIHTPIYNDLGLTSPSINQLESKSTAKAIPIVKLDETFTATVTLDGPSVYYSSITQDLSKYVKEVYIDCGVCGKKIPGATHTCKVPVELPDDTTYTITSTVVAENAISSDGIKNASMNTPDSEYKISQTKSVYVVGKIYDLQVRATDDPGWKIANAEKLSKLLLGEKGDNAVTAYKNGIKLGYRAFFDLKTLGVATNDIKIIPNIYYVTTNGAVHDVDINGTGGNNSLELYYKDSPTTYKKLSSKDIAINMSMTTTKGNVNNNAFDTEKSRMLMFDTNINYVKTLKIGGLQQIILGKENSVSTKYNGYYINPINNSRRWYGEVYVPASTVVATKSATLTDLARGTAGKVMNTGYLLITFEDIYSRFSSGANYLEYSMGRDAYGNDIGFTNSPMWSEKNGKNSVVLPDGKTFSGYAQTEAPIIVYDISLRANNDYEQTGTH